MKKIIALLLALVMALTLVACATTKPNTTTAPNSGNDNTKPNDSTEGTDPVENPLAGTYLPAHPWQRQRKPSQFRPGHRSSDRN